MLTYYFDNVSETLLNINIQDIMLLEVSTSDIPVLHNISLSVYDLIYKSNLYLKIT